MTLDRLSIRASPPLIGGIRGPSPAIGTDQKNIRGMTGPGDIGPGGPELPVSSGLTDNPADGLKPFW